MDNLIKALTIFRKYGNPPRPTHCEHDVMYIVGIDYDGVSGADKSELDKLGFVKDDLDGHGFMSHRFGSA